MYLPIFSLLAPDGVAGRSVLLWKSAGPPLRAGSKLPLRRTPFEFYPKRPSLSDPLSMGMGQ